MDSRKSTIGLSAIIALHMVVAALHGVAHTEIPVPLSLSDTLFIVIVISLAPPVALIMIWTRFQKIGLWLMLLAMFASLIFGFYHHFVEVGTDNAFFLSPSDWSIVFQLTAVLLVFIETAGCIVSVLALRARPATEAAK